MDKKNKKDKKSRNDMKNKNDIKNKKKKTKKHKKLKKILLVISLILLIFGGVFAYKVHLNGGGLAGMLATVVGHDQNTKKNLGEFRALILGISTDQVGVELTDTIMVASYNPNTQKATLLSIPRDTYTGKNTARATAYEKINALYGRKHRPDETLEAVNELTGLNIEYYVVVKTEALIKLVDAIGGVTFNVPIDMDYDDDGQDLHIHLKAGEQKLDGDKAEQVVRFRHNNDMTSFPSEYGDNDIGRMRTQRDFIMQVIKQLAKPENIFKIGEILEIAKEDLITNVDINVVKDYIPYAVEFDTENLLTATLPGTVPSLKSTNGVSIYVVNKNEAKELIEEIFHNRDIVETENETSNNSEVENNKTENNTTSNNITANNTASQTQQTINKSDIKLEVLNGSGENSSLQKVVKQLEGAGYKVTRTGTTNTTSKTTIADKKGIKETYLKNIKDVIGVGVISSSESSSSKVDITIVIGADYK